ncbi:hypothetical protein ACJ73_10237 [Blastomyces percursus]|uniref:Uncharacterized protein n=1 Tax=Blastomyces percursus TaxID=1658174 RepID=A0A1J9NY47_9EURO|nr:hypothetical protein ACJ73_10237 [Blastomyces percursus]
MAPNILKSLTVAAGLLASASIAAPVNHRVVWETVTELVEETVMVTSTAVDDSSIYFICSSDTH